MKDCLVACQQAKDTRWGSGSLQRKDRGYRLHAILVTGSLDSKLFSVRSNDYHHLPHQLCRAHVGSGFACQAATDKQSLGLDAGFQILHKLPKISRDFQRNLYTPIIFCVKQIEVSVLWVEADAVAVLFDVFDVVFCLLWGRLVKGKVFFCDLTCWCQYVSDLKWNERADDQNLWKDAQEEAWAEGLK